MQYVWGQGYIDNLLLHREGGDTWYHLTDVQFSTVAILDGAAALVERVSYDAYGKARHHYMADWEGNGGVTQAKIDQINTVAGGANHAIGEANYNPDMDIDRNGDVQTADYTIANTEGTHAALAKGLISDPSVDNQIGYDSYVFNAETLQYLARNRNYDPDHGRWIERDPAGYVDGMNLYEYVGGRPTVILDPRGLKGCCGADVSSCITAIGSNLNTIFGNLTTKRQRKLCQSVIGLRHWDIHALAFNRHFFKQGKCNQSGDCKDTVTVAGGCFKAEWVNYYLWGRIRALCGNSENSSIRWVQGYRFYTATLGAGTRGRILFTMLGYRNLPLRASSRALSGSARNMKKCKPCTSQQYDGDLDVSLGPWNDLRLSHLFFRVNCRNGQLIGGASFRDAVPGVDPYPYGGEYPTY